MYIYHIFFINSLAEGYLGCLQFLTVRYNTAMNITEQVFLWYDYISFGYMPKSVIAGSWDTLIPNFLRNCHTDFQSGCTSLNSHQQWRSVPSAPHPLKHELSLVLFFSLTILTEVRSNFKILLICILWMAKNVEHFISWP